MRTPRYAISVQALGPGQVFGWSALLNDHDTLFQVRARELTTALRFDGASLKAKCRENAPLGCEIFSRTLRVVAGAYAQPNCGSPRCAAYASDSAKRNKTAAGGVSLFR